MVSAVVACMVIALMCVVIASYGLDYDKLAVYGREISLFREGGTKGCPGGSLFHCDCKLGGCPDHCIVLLPSAMYSSVKSRENSFMK